MDDEGTEELRLLPPDGMSPSELAALQVADVIERNAGSDRVPTDPSRLQFSIAEMLLVMTSGAIGLAGGYWVAASLFAGLVGLLTLAILGALAVWLPDSRLLRYAWWSMSAMYATAVCAAVFRHGTGP